MNLLIKVIPFCGSEKALEIVNEGLATYPSRFIEVEVLQFLFSFTEILLKDSSIDSDPWEKLPGLYFLWNVFQEDFDCAKSLKDKALEYFLTLLKFKEFNTFASTACIKAISNMLAKISIDSSIQVFSGIISLLSSKKGGVSAFIESIEKKHEILSVLVELSTTNHSK